jgi:hypothetical protein
VIGMREPHGVHVSNYKGHPVLNLPFGKDGKTFGFGVGKARQILEEFHKIEDVASSGLGYTLEIGGKFPKSWNIKPEQVLSIVSYVNDIEIFVEG